jgi:transposase
MNTGRSCFIPVPDSTSKLSSPLTELDKPALCDRVSLGGEMNMTNRQYSDEFKQQILEECRQIGNASLVARRHQISKSTVHGWMRAEGKRGSTEPLPRDEQKRLKEVEKRLGKLSQENDQLKRLVAEKELELAVLRDLRDSVNPQ